MRLVPRLVAVAAIAAAAVAVVPAGAYQRPSRVTRVSVSSTGQQATYPPGLGTDVAMTGTAVARSGRYVAFGSTATNLVPEDDNNASDVFRHDTRTGATSLVSAGMGGAPAVGACAGDPTLTLTTLGSRSPSMTPDGRYVAFDSCATNLVPGDTNMGRDVFVRDVKTGATTRVSVDSHGNQAGYAAGLESTGSEYPSISADGRYVAFLSFAGNLVPGDSNNAPDIFVHDMRTGRTVRVSVGGGGAQAQGGSYDPGSISANGRYVAFATSTSLVAADQNSANDVYVHDLRTGRTELVSVGISGTQDQVFSSSLPLQGGPFVSGDGRYVVFDSDATNLVPNDTNVCTYAGVCSDVFVRDRRLHRTERVSISSDGSRQANGDSGLFGAALSADGRAVVFESMASNLGERTDTGPMSCGRGGQIGCDDDVFVSDRATGTTEWESTDGSGNEGYCGGSSQPSPVDNAEGLLLDVGGGCDSFDPSVSPDGRYIGFISPAGNLVAGDTNHDDDVFLRDRGPTLGTGAVTRLVTIASAPAFARTERLVVHDSRRDVSGAPTTQGANLIGATLAYRPQHGDLFFRLPVQRMPLFALADPTLVYGVNLTVTGVHYQVRAAKTGPLTASFGLFRRDAGNIWTQVATLDGGYGTTGQEVVVALPLRDIGATRGGRLTHVDAFTGLGTFLTGATTVVDHVAIGAAS